jgi:hypothetical protein
MVPTTGPRIINICSQTTGMGDLNGNGEMLPDLPASGERSNDQQRLGRGATDQQRPLAGVTPSVVVIS